nr:MAG TPA: NB glycoprotein [Caudoviricetes sp.]
MQFFLFQLVPRCTPLCNDRCSHWCSHFFAKLGSGGE